MVSDLRHSDGFSLLELLVAVAVLSLVLVPLMGSQSDTIQRVTDLKARSYARLVAENQISLLRASNSPLSAGLRSGSATQGGIDFRWQAVIKSQPNSRLLILDMTVTGPDDQRPLAQLTGFRRAQR